MIDETGARLQESLREHPAVRETRQIDRILKGTIVGIKWRDDTENQTGQTLVDLILWGGYPNINNVPMSAEKFHQGNGEEWSPELGDLVLVAFVNGSWSEPVIIKHLHLPQEGDDAVQAATADAPQDKRRYHFRCNKADIAVDKDGNRITVIEAHDPLTIKTGDYSIDVVDGKCTVHVLGKTVWTSEGTIELDGGSSAPKGCVQLDSICPLLRASHIHGSATVKASK